MIVKIKVTQQILEKSKNCSKLMATKNCAIAESIREILPYAGVFQDQIVPMYYAPVDTDVLDHINSIIELPMSAKVFIERFDSRSPEARAKMEPISFDIDVPNELIAQIGISEVYSVLSTSRTLELVSI